MPIKHGAFALISAGVLSLGCGEAAAQGKPLSAINWLSDTVARPPAQVMPQPPVRPVGEPEVIETTPLAARNLDAVGLLNQRVTGMDPLLWARSDQTLLIERILDDVPEPLPALRDLVQMMMLAELAPPMGSDGQGRFLLARIDRLLAFGALEAADMLIREAGAPTPDLFRRSFDIALLLGTEDRACAAQRATPRIAPTFPARIFCLARSGDWGAAELTLATGRALGHVTEEELHLLQRFIDPEAFEEEEPLPPPERVTPLNLRIYEAIGEPLPATGQPLAFAHADLSATTGWKARIEAAERLTRSGGLAPQTLFALYTERKAAASGGVWDRVRAVQALETALSSADPARIGPALQKLWPLMAALELEVPLAEHYARILATLRFSTPEDRALQLKLALLGPDYQKIAEGFAPETQEERFLIGLARGRIDEEPPPDNLARAIARAFPGTGIAPAPDEASQQLLRQQRFGEAALAAIDQVTTGAMGDLRRVTDGLLVMRQLGFEGAARKAALQLILLERRG